MGQGCVRAVDRDRLPFEGHGGVEVAHAFERGDHEALLGLRREDLLLLPRLEHEALEALEKLRRVEPDLDLELAPDAVGVDDPPSLDQRFLLHGFPPAA